MFTGIIEQLGIIEAPGKVSGIKAFGAGALVVVGVGVVGAVLFATGVLELSNTSESGTWSSLITQAEKKLLALKQRFYALDEEIFGVGL